MKKTRLSILLVIALVIASCISIFACTYSVSVYHDNTATVYYYQDGITSTSFSWDNSNYHSSVNYSESYRGYIHSGILTSYATSSSDTVTYVFTDPSADWYQ
jgi:hypothetical protein